MKYMYQVTNNKIIKPIVLVLLMTITVFAINSCTKKFEDYNRYQDYVTNDMLTRDYMVIYGFFVQMEKNVIPGGNNSTDEVNNYQLSENLQGDIWSGYMGVTNLWNNGSNNSTYSLIPNWISAAFQNTFTGVMPAWNKIKNLTIDKDSTNDSYKAIFAMAQIIKAFAVSRTTDMYGPLPYLKFGQSATATPYDSQEAIYNSFFSELDHAIVDLKSYLTKNNNVSPSTEYEVIYKGDYAKWILFANTLKLRLAMRLAYVNEILAKTKAEETVRSGLGFIEIKANNALFRSSGVFTLINPIAYIQENYKDIRLGANLQSFLAGYNDPRLPAMCRTVNGGYYSIRNGISINSSQQNSYQNNTSLVNIATTDPLPWITAPESLFLRAEGALRGWNMGNSAKYFYESGVSASFDQWNVGAATTYLANTINKPAAYKDTVNPANNISAGSIVPGSSRLVLDTISIKWNESQSMELKLRRIITQKWIALFPDGQEAWSEFRRTNYPYIFPVVLNRSNGVISTSIQIRRIIYPQSEYRTNAAGVAQGISMLNGADNGGTQLWWDKKSHP